MRTVPTSPVGGAYWIACPPPYAAPPARAQKASVVCCLQAGASVRPAAVELVPAGVLPSLILLDVVVVFQGLLSRSGDGGPYLLAACIAADLRLRT